LDFARRRHTKMELRSIATQNAAKNWGVWSDELHHDLAMCAHIFYRKNLIKILLQQNGKLKTGIA